MHHYEHFWLDPKFWVAVSFVIFFLLLGKKIWAALTGALDSRAAQIRASLDEAARLRSEAEAMLRQAEAEGIGDGHALPGEHCQPTGGNRPERLTGLGILNLRSKLGNKCRQRQRCR